MFGVARLYTVPVSNLDFVRISGAPFMSGRRHARRMAGFSQFNILYFLGVNTDKEKFVNITKKML